MSRRLTQTRELYLAWQFNRRRPWITRFSIDGRAYGGAVSFENDDRVIEFCATFPDARTVLDLGSLEGGQTFELAHRLPNARILGIEGRQTNIDKARFVQRLLKIENAEFMLGNIEVLRLADLGHFDAVLCSGLLYHLPRPWMLLDSLNQVTGRVYISTHFADESRIDAENEGIAGHWYQEYGAQDPLSGLSQRSFWLPVDTIVGRLEAGGFRVSIKSFNHDHPAGPTVNLVAEQSDDEAKSAG